MEDFLIYDSYNIPNIEINEKTFCHKIPAFCSNLSENGEKGGA